MATLNVLGHEFEILNLSNILSETLPLPPLGAVYLFTREEGNGNHKILYVGRTKNLVNRDIKNHQQLVCIYLKQGTSFCIHPDLDADSRETKENMIKDLYNPPCNDTPVK